MDDSEAGMNEAGDEAGRFRCTYRLQLEPGRGFAHACALVPYLRRLGVSHLYLSPVTEARSGSTHGYDVVDPTAVSVALGGEDELRALAGEGLGLIIDAVPNHMAADELENPFWRDALWRAKFFDLDWRTGQHRRFFDIGELAGVRVEDPEVFETTHRKLIELVHDGVADGLRIDHPDGLANPARYLARLAESGVRHVWVEKILEPGERLRDWPVEGTTGYEFMGEVTALFVDPRGEEPLTHLYEEVSGESRSFAEIASAAKLEQAATTFSDEVDRLAALLPEELAGAVDLPRALASLPVYRTYVEPDTGKVEPADRAAIAEARIDQALAELLTLARRGHDAFVTRFQQTTPSVTAKGVEDTALYRYHRLLALNEVGSDPARFSLAVEDFHGACLRRQESHPLGLLATTTHDTKRSADVRARLAALAAIPERWRGLVELARRAVPGPGDPLDEYFVLQTLAGTWPLEPERIVAYLEKALREGKRRTSWIDPDPAWEGAVTGYAGRLIESVAFRQGFDPFVAELAAEAERASLGMALLKLTTPGVPDLYQGDELEFRALVDPDNRRPVDWDARRVALARSQPGTKIDLVRRALELRVRRPAPFAAAYEPIEAGVDICSFSRGGDLVVAVAVRGDLRAWSPPRGEWRDVLEPHPWRRLLERA